VRRQLPADEESLRLELREAIATFREQAGRMTQGIGFVVTADSLLLAYGFSQKESGILFIASLMPVLALAIFFHFLRVSEPVVYVAMVLERQLRLDDVPLIGIHAKKGFKQVHALVANSLNPADESVSDSVLALSYKDWVNRPIAHVLYCIFVAQLLLFAISMAVYGYRFM
jgi:hypothetical protein